jgi:hypothetical protein
VIFVDIPNSRSRHKDKLAPRFIMAEEPATPGFLHWSQYLIQFSTKDQWTRVSNAGLYPLILDPTIIGMTVTKVLIDGGVRLNIIFSNTLWKMGVDFLKMMTPTCIPFYRIGLGEVATPRPDHPTHYIWEPQKLLYRVHQVRSGRL